jgi:hypothetical protein
MKNLNDIMNLLKTKSNDRWPEVSLDKYKNVKFSSHFDKFIKNDLNCNSKENTQILNIKPEQLSFNNDWINSFNNFFNFFKVKPNDRWPEVSLDRYKNAKFCSHYDNYFKSDNFENTDVVVSLGNFFKKIILIISEWYNGSKSDYSYLNKLDYDAYFQKGYYSDINILNNSLWTFIYFIIFIIILASLYYFKDIKITILYILQFLKKLALFIFISPGILFFQLDIERNFNTRIEKIREYEKQSIRDFIETNINDVENVDLKNKKIINKYNDNINNNKLSNKKSKN